MPIIDVSKGIFAKYQGSALASVLTGGLHDSEAPQNVVFPYAVYENISWLRDSDEPFGQVMEYHRWQFTIWTDELDKTKAITGIGALVATLKSVYDNTDLTISGWTATIMQFTGGRSAYSEDSQVIGAIVEYELHINQ
jgi:hypothetical protein